MVMLLLVEPGNHMIYFDNCCRGGAREKGTAWWSSFDWFTCLAAHCDGSPFHEKWNAKFVSGEVLLPTHLEVAYPVLLCARLAAVAEIKVIDMEQLKLKTLSNKHSMHLRLNTESCWTCCPGAANSSFLLLNLSYIDFFTREFFGSMMVARKNSMIHAAVNTLHMQR